MPELPDVENYRRYLARHALKKPIREVTVNAARVVDGMSATKLARSLKGETFRETRRRGKHLLVALDGGRWLTFHFGMTGRFAYFREMAEDPAHDRLRVDFRSGDHLAFVNQRLLGRVGLAESAEGFIESKGLGPDALQVDAARFRDRMSAKNSTLKSALMDQGVVAGIGNIFSDEIMFHARLHPETPVRRLDEDALSTLHRKLRHVLEMAIEKGAGTEDFADKVPATWLLSRRRDGAPCPRCTGRIAALKVNGRTAYHCPSCQAKGG